MRERRPTSSRPGGVPRAGPAPGWVAAELRSTARVSARKATDLALNPLSLVHELDDEDHRRRRACPGRKPPEGERPTFSAYHVAVSATPCAKNQVPATVRRRPFHQEPHPSGTRTGRFFSAT